MEKNIKPRKPVAITKLDKSLGVLERLSFVVEGIITRVDSPL